MPKSKKLTAVYALIMDLPLSIVVTIVALALGGNLSMERFIPSYIPTLIIATVWYPVADKASRAICHE